MPSVGCDCSDEGEGMVREPLLLLQNTYPIGELKKYEQLQTNEHEDSVARRVWIESKKLWHVAGPSIFSRVTSYTMNVITLVYAGHLGGLELASISIAVNVIIGFNFGLLLGMASALETLCGQAFGAKKYNMLGIYLQRSWIVMIITAVLLLPMYIFITPILKLLGEPADVAELSGLLAWWLIPVHLALALYLPVHRFLQSQLKTVVVAWVALAGLVVHVIISWILVSVLGLGAVGAVVALDVSWWFLWFGLLAYTMCGGRWVPFVLDWFLLPGIFWALGICQALCSFWGHVMICYYCINSLETWYYKILILMSGTLKNAEIALDALSICQSIDSWEMMIPTAFLGATGVRVANELGAGNSKGAKFATVVSVATSATIGLLICILIMIFRDQLALFFTSSSLVLAAVDKLVILLAFTTLHNSVQPVLSGVAVGSGWQAIVAYINVGCYYIIGVPFGALLGKVFNFGVMGMWGGMIGGTSVQTLILAIITLRTDWEKEAENTLSNVERWADPNPK